MTTTPVEHPAGPVCAEGPEFREPAPPPYFAPTPPRVPEPTPLERALEQSLDPPSHDEPPPAVPAPRPRRRRRGWAFASAGCLLLLLGGGSAGAVGLWFALDGSVPGDLEGLAGSLPGLDQLGPIGGLAGEAPDLDVVGLGEEAVILDADAEEPASDPDDASDPGPTASNRVPLEHIPAAVSGVGDSLVVRATTWGRETCTVLLKLRPLDRDWEVHTLARAGEHHSLELAVSSDLAPAFEYALFATECGAARWPADGSAHQIWLD